MKNTNSDSEEELIGWNEVIPSSKPAEVLED